MISSLKDRSIYIQGKAKKVIQGNNARSIGPSKIGALRASLKQSPIKNTMKPNNQRDMSRTDRVEPNI